jgi:Peptidase M15
MKLKVVSDTLFKLSPDLSQNLTDAQKVFVKNGTEFEVHSHMPEGNHVKVALANVFLGPENRNTWYIYCPDIEIDGDEPDNKPDDQDDPPAAAQPANFKLPGYPSVNLSSPVIPGGHFTWAEVTKNGTRPLASKSVVDGAIKIAKAMEEVRALFDNRPIRINSWYRDPASNKRAGGASRSRHLEGDAIDFTVQGIPPSQVHAKLEPWWGNRGGIASSSKFTHIDARGYKARWKYPF